MNGSRKSGKFFHFSVLGWTQEEIAEKLGLSSHASVSEIVRNRHLSDFDKLLIPVRTDEFTGIGQVAVFGKNVGHRLLCYVKFLPNLFLRPA